MANQSNPEAPADIYAAAIVGDSEAVQRFVDREPGSATAKGGPRGWDALTYLCFSEHLRLHPKRSDRFLRAATALLDAGADPNTGFFENSHEPKPTFESALYGAAGVAHHAGLTRLLLSRGADPNDDEVSYHAPETRDNGTLWALVESGKLTADSLAIMLVRKADWHDYDGVNYLLAHGADPNRMTMWHVTALHQAVRRDNEQANVEAMLDHGADPLIETGLDGRSAVAMAARRGRGDLLDLFEQRGIPLDLRGVDRLIAACAKGDVAAVRAIAADDGTFVKEVAADGGTLLAQFAGTGSVDGVRCLLDLGVDPHALYEQGDAYFGVAPNSMALHAAAWRAHPAVVQLLLDRGAQPDALDGSGRTPLALAVRACVDSYWMDRRSPRSVEALLRAGASPKTAVFPSGYREVDELLQARGA